MISFFFRVGARLDTVRTCDVGNATGGAHVPMYVLVYVFCSTHQLMQVPAHSSPLPAPPPRGR